LLSQLVEEEKNVTLALKRIMSYLKIMEMRLFNLKSVGTRFSQLQKSTKNNV
jgi:hypothetical protein